MGNIEVVYESTSVKTPVKRPTSCHQVALVTPELGELGCKRLPRHKGDHRSTLKSAPVTRVKTGTSRKSSRVSKVGAKRLAENLASKVESGELAPSVALSRYSAYVTRLANKRARVTTPAA